MLCILLILFFVSSCSFLTSCCFDVDASRIPDLFLQSKIITVTKKKGKMSAFFSFFFLFVWFFCWCCCLMAAKGFGTGCNTFIRASRNDIRIHFHIHLSLQFQMLSTFWLPRKCPFKIINTVTNVHQEFYH